MEDDFTAFLRVPDFPRELEFTARGGLLTLEGERQRAFKARGVSHIRYTVARVPLGQINHLADMTRGRFESPACRSSAFSAYIIAHVRRTVVTTEKLNDWQAFWNAFDVQEPLTAADTSDPEASRGRFFITEEAGPPDPEWRRVTVSRHPLPPHGSRGEDADPEEEGNE